jgi:DNA helicase-2/ATP-dependent DNA helicase PcrA
MDDIFNVEKQYLETTKKIIELEIEKCRKSEDKAKEESVHLSFEDRLRGTHFNLNSQLHDVGERIYKLERSKECPYFGRFDFKGEDIEQLRSVYIGKHNISNESTYIVYDWRSPICSLYYDSEVGPVSYESPSGTKKGDLILKRQIIIKNGELINTVDSNLVSNDELLIPYLSESADDRMKIIIASIQKEQNKIIRMGNHDIIVQGVAGSGKTSVALHRIAYLLYNMKNKNSNNFLVIGPNDYFLNYVSSVLPDLDATAVEQKTLLALTNEFIGIELALCPDILVNNFQKQRMQKRISAFKGSQEYKLLLDNFITKCFVGNTMVSEDFTIDGKTVFTAEEIREDLIRDGCYFNFEKTKMRFKKFFKENHESIYMELNKDYRDTYMSLPKGDPVRNEVIQKSNELKKLVKEKGLSLLDKYFKSINKSCLVLYALFISELDQMNTSLSEEEIKILQKDTLTSIRKKQVHFEDLASLLYLNHKLTNKKLDYKNLIIDEGQDYSEFTYLVLKKICPSAKFNIYGDMAQAIYPYRSVKSWAQLNNAVFDGKCVVMELNKSYRTTIEITETANHVLELLKLHPAEPVIRHGNAVTYKDMNNFNKIDQIFDWMTSDYQTVAVICKDDEEAKNVNQELRNNGIESRYISKEDNTYTSGVFTLSVASAKGLEFDCVLLNNASSKKYDPNNETDMHLLYVATTRALHEQVVMYDGEITLPLKGQLKQDKVLSKKNKTIIYR